MFNLLPQPTDSAFDHERMTMIAKRLKGHATHENMVDWFRESFKDEIMAKLRRWSQGNLFPSQTMSFENWLGIEKWKWQQEVKDANEMLGILEAAKETMPEGFRQFCDLRIFTPSLGKRKEVSESRQTEISLRIWVAQNSKYGWNWK